MMMVRSLALKTFFSRRHYFMGKIKRMEEIPRILDLGHVLLANKTINFLSMSVQYLNSGYGTGGMK